MKRLLVATLFAVLLTVLLASVAFAKESQYPLSDGMDVTVGFGKSFGGNDLDLFESIIETEGSYVTAGYSLRGKNDTQDAIIYKFTPPETELPAKEFLPAYFTATIPTFNVTMNGVIIDNKNLQYPFIVYNDITYFPMTYHDSRFLGIGTNYTKETGLEVFRLEESGEYKGENGNSVNPQNFSVATATGKITVNGKTIDNSAEEYPLLLFRDVTYFPMTWRFCVDEFGWSYKFDSTNGLVISTK